MAERMIGLESEVAIAELPAIVDTAEKTIGFCVSDGRKWHPVALPEGSDIAFLKDAVGAMAVSELLYDVAGSNYREVTDGPIKENHVYEIFPADKVGSFVDEYGVRR